jgi:TM2 domain-containing membrane protein YozV
MCGRKYELREASEKYYEACEDGYMPPYFCTPKCQNEYGRKKFRKWLTALLLCLFLGWTGIHRFYTGRIFTGILQLITFGGLGIWWLIDLIMLLTGKYRGKTKYENPYGQKRSYSPQKHSYIISRAELDWDDFKFLTKNLWQL